MTWQPIETAPKDGTWVLLYDPKTTCGIYTGYYDPCYMGPRIGGWFNGHMSDEEYVEIFPTHWMPLPPKPEQD